MPGSIPDDIDKLTLRERWKSRCPSRDTVATVAVGMGAIAGVRLLVHAVEAGSSRMFFSRIMRLTLSGSGRNGCRPSAWST